MNPRRFYCRYRNIYKVVWVDAVKFDVEWRKDSNWIAPLPLSQDLVASGAV
jgi:hypothetical protein